MDANLCYQKQKKKKEVEFSADLKLKQCTSFVMFKNHCVQLYLGVWSVIEKIMYVYVCLLVFFSFFFLFFFPLCFHLSLFQIVNLFFSLSAVLKCIQSATEINSTRTKAKN